MNLGFLVVTRRHLTVWAVFTVLWWVGTRNVPDFPTGSLPWLQTLLVGEAGYHYHWMRRRHRANRAANIVLVEPRDWERWLHAHPHRGAARVAVVAVTLMLRAGRWRWTGRSVARLRRLFRFVLLVGRLTGQRRRDGIHLVKVSRAWNRTCQAYGLVNTTLAKTKIPPRLFKVKPTIQGNVTAMCAAGRIGVDIDQVVKKRTQLAQGIGCRSMEVTPLTSDNGNGMAEIMFRFSDPIANILTLGQLPPSPSGTIAYAIRSDGSAAWIWQHMTTLIGGLTRKGKSVICRTMMADLIRKDVPVKFYVVDLKDGVELPEFEWAIKHGNKNPNFQIAGYARTVEQAEKLLVDMRNQMMARADWMREKRIKQITPSRRFPLLVGLIDETLPWPEMLKEGTKHPAGQIAFTGAARCVALWLNAQTGEKSALGQLRDLIPQRLSFSVKTWQQTDMILGENAHDNGADAHRIGDVPGVGYSGDNSSPNYSKFRAPLVTEAETEMIANGRIPKMIPADTKECCTYRVYSKGGRGRLEYVGETVARLVNGIPELRFAQHRANDWRYCAEHRQWENWWLTHVDESTTKIDRYPSKQAALRAEEDAIKGEKPYWNIEHNRRNPYSAMADHYRLHRRTDWGVPEPGPAQTVEVATPVSAVESVEDSAVEMTRRARRLAARMDRRTTAQQRRTTRKTAPVKPLPPVRVPARSSYHWEGGE